MLLSRKAVKKVQLSQAPGQAVRSWDFPVTHGYSSLWLASAEHTSFVIPAFLFIPAGGLAFLSHQDSCLGKNMPLIAQSSAEVFTITDMNGELDNQPWTIWGGFGLVKIRCVFILWHKVVPTFLGILPERNENVFTNVSLQTVYSCHTYHSSKLEIT